MDETPEPVLIAKEMKAIAPIDDDRLRQAAELLLEARRERRPIQELPPGLRPNNLVEAYRLQDIMISAMGPIGGWKVGASSPAAPPLCAPLPLRGGFATIDSTLHSRFSRLRGVEAEIAYRLKHDLPARDQDYSREEVLAAIESAHPAIEILESAFDHPERIDSLSIIGDLAMNGGFAYGEAYAGWREADLSKESVEVVIDGVIRSEATASNSAGSDLVRLLVWLANEGQFRTGGLRAGDWITTGSWTQDELASAASAVMVRFSSFGEAKISFSQ